MTPLSEPSAECRSHPILPCFPKKREKRWSSPPVPWVSQGSPPPIRAAPVSGNHHQSKRRNVRSPPPRHNGEHMQRLMAHDCETDLPCFEDWNSHLSLVAEAANRDDGGWLIMCTKYWWGWCSAHLYVFLNANLVRSNKRATKYQQTTNRNDVPSEISSSLIQLLWCCDVVFFPGMLFVSMTAQGSLLPNPSQLHPNVGHLNESFPP